MLQLHKGIIYTLISNIAFVAVSCLMRFTDSDQLFAVQTWSSVVKFALSYLLYVKNHKLSIHDFMTRESLYIAGCQFISVPGYILLALAV
jgi:hypothetical protein